jgi:general stress protein 26
VVHRKPWNFGWRAPFFRQAETGMPDQDDIERVWDLVEKVGVGMLTTQFPGGLRARPIEPRLDRDEGVIRFVTDVHGLKDDEIERAPDVNFVVIDAGDKAYLSITGRAAVTHDPAMAKKIWHKSDDVWWPDGPDDDNVRIIVLTPSRAELWDGPSSSLLAALRVRQGEDDREEAGARREPQEDPLAAIEVKGSATFPPHALRPIVRRLLP